MVFKKEGIKLSLPATGEAFSRKRQTGIKVYELNMVKQAHLTTIPKLIKIIKAEDVEIVSTHSSVDSWAGGIAAKITGRRLVRFRHNLYPIGSGPLVKIIYSMPDRIIAISNTVKDVLVQHGLKKEEVMVIPDAVDAAVFSPEADDIREELGISPDTLVIGNTSTFTEVKGQEYLLQSFNVISRKVSCILLFAGRLIEPAKSRYLSYVDPEFRNKVIFLGHRDDVQKVLKTIDVFIYPSFLEGLGTALLEAMTMGKPVAVSDIPTFRDFIKEGENGLYFRAKDSEDLAEKAVALLRDKKLRERLGGNARASAFEKFTLDKMIDLTKAQYREVLGEMHKK